MRILLQEKQVIIRSDWLPSPKLIITCLHDAAYMEQLKEELSEIKRFCKSSALQRVAETVN
ncbi:MAG: hypothetical protein CEE38_13725 [Planctomycetes bacterium B3_Pla]|nr:MAG: hypothetical protein CEE38_13725 [Planctomycetes bacterium B3_Pla]